MADKLIDELIRKEDFLRDDFIIACIDQAIEVLQDQESLAGECSNYSILDDRLYDYQIQNGVYTDEETMAINDSLSTFDNNMIDYSAQDIGYDIVYSILDEVREKLVDKLKANNKQF